MEVGFLLAGIRECMQICKHGGSKSVYAKTPLFQELYGTKTWANAYNSYPANYKNLSYYPNFFNNDYSILNFGANKKQPNK